MRVSVIVAAVTVPALTRAEPATHEADESTQLAKTSQNPVGDLTSIPLQFNFNNGGGGLGDQTAVNLNFQPVLPIHLSPDWNLISRTIVPVLSLPITATMRENGIGDIEEELFITPAKSTGLVWGVGPILSLPTATVEASATGSWAAGPAGLVVWLEGPWVIGALGTAAWTFADYGDARKVGSFLAQPFVNFNLGEGWALTTAPIITFDWGNPGTPAWTVPVGGGVSWTTRIGSQAMTLSAQYYANVVREDTTPRNQLRLVVSFLFPQVRGK
jgi:hypothetical protein